MKPMAYPNRFYIICLVLFLFAVLVVARLVDLNINERAFLEDQGAQRVVRDVPIHAQRGIIFDRQNRPLAVSAPLIDIKLDPQKINIQSPVVALISESFDLDEKDFFTELKQEKEQGRRYLYLGKKLKPSKAQAMIETALNKAEVLEQSAINHYQSLGWSAKKIKVAIKQQGLVSAIKRIQQEEVSQRYYPASEVAAHVVGSVGAESKHHLGLEHAFNEHLQGMPGQKRVKKDRKGNIIEDLSLVRAAKPGNDLHLSVDLRLQYVAFRELKAAVESHRAKAGTAVILDIKTGEVLAMANLPSYNPHVRPSGEGFEITRNRALRSEFEPGSTMKPLSMVAALMSKQYQADDVINTSPGYIRINNRTIRDSRNYGSLDLKGIVTKSSNVGTSKIALSLPENAIRDTFSMFGIGEPLYTGFTREVSGKLPFYDNWNPVNVASMAFGYGITVSPTQLAQAYAIIGGLGLKRPVSLRRLDAPVEAERVIPEGIAKEVISMMESVVSDAGSGRLAKVTNYRVAGKTGTVHKNSGGAYLDDVYTSIFAGLVPASDPRLVCVVVIEEPQNEKYYGGEVAAPVFSRIMTESVRILNIPPDDQVLVTRS